MINVVLPVTLNMINNDYVVYSIMDARTAVVQYIGMCRYIDLLKLPDARTNIRFNEMITPDMRILVRVIGQFDNKTEASIEQRKQIISNNSPEMNRSSHYTRFAHVQCIETGEIFDNAMHACKVHNISQPALSNHLNGRDGYNSVKGRRYVRIKPPVKYPPASQNP